MSGEPPRPPDGERALGLEFYLSRTPPVPGRLKARAEEFRVSEISSYPLPDPEGAFVVLRIASQDWEQHELGGAIARRLGLGPHAIQWSGTKDRRAQTDRLLSYRGPLPSGDLGLPRVEVREAYRARDGLVLGHHYGNAFEIRVSELAVPSEEARSIFQRTAEELRAAGGFPNLFGLQRFGEVRPITHVVGRYLVQGDLAGAVDAYLTARPVGGTPGAGDAARAAYATHQDPVRALAEFPPEYRFERALLERLAKGQGPDRALRALSRDLRLLFVHAFQALLFNRWVSRRHRAGLPLSAPSAGDRILRVGRDGTVRSQDAVPVAEDNLPECRDLVARGRALVAGPLVGFETPPGAGAVGELLAAVLAEEGVTPDMFRLSAAPEVASRGGWRPILLPLPPIDLAPDGDGLWFRFGLPKGAYATVLLREFLKPGAAGSGAEPFRLTGGDEFSNT